MLSPGPAWEVAAGKARVIVALATLVVTAVLVVFAAQLHSTQSATRRDVASRFHDRAAVASALTQAIFSSAAASPDAAKEYGTATVRARALDGAVKREHLEYAALLNERGTIIARSRGLKNQELSGLASRSVTWRVALRRARFSISDVIPAGHQQVIEFAVPLETPHGRRVLVSGS